MRRLWRNHLDRLHLEESIQFLGRDLRRFRASAAPRYPDLLGSVCEKLGWDPARFRGYRCVVDYPIYGSQVTVAAYFVLKKIQPATAEVAFPLLFQQT